jgi:tRNA-guanine family transglycosylase
MHVPRASHLIVDSGGFQAATKWDSVFPYRAEDLHRWAVDIGADVVAGMDIACETGIELLEKGLLEWGITDTYEQRMWLSLRYQTWQREVYEAYDYADHHTFMPVVQGNTVDDYRWYIDEMRLRGLDEYPWIGVGTICKRGSTEEILDVVRLIRTAFPDKHIHLFGATLNIYKDRRFAGLFDSSDSAAWNWGASTGHEARRQLSAYIEKAERYAAALADDHASNLGAWV